MKSKLDYSGLYKKLWPKYILDRILAFPALVAASPLILLASFLIKLDGLLHPEHAGSVFYAEPRMSAGKLFQVVKFRTVPEKVVAWLRKNPESRSITGCDDSQRTCAGRFILRWYLDEAPQLINILKGEMSFVGPRPHIIKQSKDEIKQGFLYRQVMKAGLFGVPQACKRHPKYHAILEHMAKTHRPDIKVLNTLDGLYAKKCLHNSVFGILLFDVAIVVRCIVVIIRGTS